MLIERSILIRSDSIKLSILQRSGPQHLLCVSVCCWKLIFPLSGRKIDACLMEGEEKRSGFDCSSFNSLLFRDDLQRCWFSFSANILHLAPMLKRKCSLSLAVRWLFFAFSIFTPAPLSFSRCWLSTPFEMSVLSARLRITVLPEDWLFFVRRTLRRRRVCFIQFSFRTANTAPGSAMAKRSEKHNA